MERRISKNIYCYPENPNTHSLELFDPRWSIEQALSWKEVLSESCKERIFVPCISGMNRVLQENGFNPYDPTDLLNRLYVVDDDTFKRTALAWNMGSIQTALGIALPNRLALVNGTNVKKYSGNLIDEEMILRRVGIHELWHSIDYKEFWLKNKNGGIYEDGSHTYHQQRRFGIYTARPSKVPSLNGLGAIMEGFTEYRTREVMKQLYPNIDFTRYGSYVEFLEYVDYLVMFMGTDKPFYDASLTQSGMLSLIRRIKKHLPSLLERSSFV